MLNQPLNILREIGAQLDRNQFPNVYNGGSVLPSADPVVKSIKGKENRYVATRPTTRPWQRPSRRQRNAIKSRATSRSASFLSTSLRKKFEENLDSVLEAYPLTKHWISPNGIWVLSSSVLVDGLNRNATFLTGVPFSPNQKIKGWGFWTTAVSCSWIGPRHTNFPDGSICAFEPQDNTWIQGDSIIKLLDLYTVWATRHLYLEKFGRWPGYQSVLHPYERILEFQSGEFCGCENSHKLYSDCCMKSDHEKNQSELAADFAVRYLGEGIRQPPDEIIQCVVGRNNPPSITDIFG